MKKTILVLSFLSSLMCNGQEIRRYNDSSHLWILDRGIISQNPALEVDTCKAVRYYYLWPIDNGMDTILVDIEGAQLWTGNHDTDSTIHGQWKNLDGSTYDSSITFEIDGGGGTESLRIENEDSIPTISKLIGIAEFWKDMSDKWEALSDHWRELYEKTKQDLEDEKSKNSKIIYQ